MMEILRAQALADWTHYDTLARRYGSAKWAAKARWAKGLFVAFGGVLADA